MWDPSNAEPDDIMVTRCSYCGKFSSRASLHSETNLCPPCQKKLGPPTGTEPDSEAEADKMSLDEEEDAKSEGGASVGSKAESQTEEASQEPSSRPQGLGEQGEGEASSVCARCWTRPPTRVLYNSPTCDECYKEALDAKLKNEARGTKRRFQPQTPLEPGKKLTRVCPSCRHKRKRCEHRRVVNADDPEVADRRRKRTKGEAPILEDAEPEGRSSSTEADGQGISTSSLEETTASEDSSAEANLNWAIRQSVETVYRREMDRLVTVAEAKMAEATEAFDAVKRHMEAWLFEKSKGGSAS